MQHVYPLGDIREHVTNGDPCPCMPRVIEDGAVCVHNAYDRRERDELQAALLCWQKYALHLAHCRDCGRSEIHCLTGQALRDAAFEVER